MKKQVKNQIFKSVLLLLSVVLLIAGAAIGVFANTTVERNLTLTFDENVQKCVIEVRNNSNEEWQSHAEVTESGVISVPYDKSVKVTVVPVTGKWPLLNVTSDTVYTPQGNSVSWNPYKTDSSISIECTDRQYYIYALDHDKLGEIEYAVVPNGVHSIEELTSNRVIYQYGLDSLTELPRVEMEDYEFKGWNIVMGPDSFTPAIVEGTGDSARYFIPKDLTRTTYFDQEGGRIYVYPVMSPKPYPIYREDRIYDSEASNNIGDKLFTPIMQEATVEDDISAIAPNYWADDIALGGYKQYTGYILMDETEYTYVKWPVGEPPIENPHYNTVYRFYKPIQYQLTYDLNDNGDVNYTKIDTYTYANPITIEDPTRRGYTFLGWQVAIYDAETDKWINPLGQNENGNEKLTELGFQLGNGNVSIDQNGRHDPNTVFASDAQADGKYEIRLTAQWQAKSYTITYPWGEGVLVQNEAELPKEFTFDATCFIPNPYRPGYSFNGWSVYTGSGSPMADTGLNAAEGGYDLNCSEYAENITLVANWVVETYNVELDDGMDKTENTVISNVVYDQTFPVESTTVPVNYGYNFKGYFSAENEMYIDENGNRVAKVWTVDGEDGGTIVLHAVWERKPITVTVNPIEKVPEGVKITIVDKENNKEYEGNTATLLFGTEYYVKIEMPAGFKIVEWAGQKVEDYSEEIFVSGVARIETEDAIILSAVARPNAPTIGSGENVESVMVESDTSISVNFKDANVAGLYEIAISLDSNPDNLATDAWKQIAAGEQSYLFTDLTYGTFYHVFVRLKETDSTLSGIPAVEDRLTEYDKSVNDIINKLNGMFQEGDGNITKALIQTTVNKIEELKNIPRENHPENFYEQINTLVAEVEAKILFTRLQDEKIAKLEGFLNLCFLSGSFSQQNKALLDALCKAAVADISTADTEAAVNETYTTARAAMEAVPVNYLYDANGMMQLTSLSGLKQGSGIVLNSIEDVKALRRAVADAIAQGKIIADSEEAKALLRALDTVSAYNFYLVNVQPDGDDNFTFTMTIPASLAGRTGLQVAYYNAATGMVELLETTRDGDTLTFRAKQVSDFVIMADPVVNLTGVIAALGAIVLCQLIAIALVIAARNKAKNAVQHASIALPTFLAVYFLPANSEFVVLGLGIAALVLQVVLMWLLLSSDMIRVFKTKKAKPASEEVTTVVREEDLEENPTDVFDEEETTDEEQIDDAQIDEEFIEDGESDEEFIDDENAEDFFDEETEEDVVEEEAAEETFAEETFDDEAEEVYDDEEFIERAPDPYYSLDEENVYEFDEEETERVSDAEEADTETQEEGNDTDPLDGVFGEGDVQDGYDGDEAGSPRDEGSYEYPDEAGDEASAAYSETEDADRTEEEGQGTVDPKAYIVNDDEELSNEEEMYRYDE